jgi:hypothetical protein
MTYVPERNEEKRRRREQELFDGKENGEESDRKCEKMRENDQRMMFEEREKRVE